VQALRKIEFSHLKTDAIANAEVVSPVGAVILRHVVGMGEKK
jgi:hypothetical protein